MEVKRAYRNTTSGELQVRTTVATLRYDGLGRRIGKKIENCGDWDAIYHYFLDGGRVIEERAEMDVGENEPLRVHKQYVWGLNYVDELLQISVNQDPTDTAEDDEYYGGHCERSFWVAQDANYNVLGAFSQAGLLVERYEYTPYGQRTIFSRNWRVTDINGDGYVGIAEMSAYGDWTGQNVPPAPERLDYSADGSINFADFCALADNYGRKDASGNDPRVMHPRLESGGGSFGIPVGVCDFGHQGLLYDKEFGLYQNRFRYLDPRDGRFTNRDPAGYVDGMGLYQYASSSPVRFLDPSGLNPTVSSCRQQWQDMILRLFHATRQAMNTYDAWTLHERRLWRSAIQDMRGHEYEPGQSLMDEHDDWVEARERARRHYRNYIYNLSVSRGMRRQLQRMLALAKKAQWMHDEGCKCEALRWRTSSLVAAEIGPALGPNAPDLTNIPRWIMEEASGRAAKKALGKAYDQLSTAVGKLMTRDVLAKCCLWCRERGQKTELPDPWFPTSWQDLYYPLGYWVRNGRSWSYVPYRPITQIGIHQVGDSRYYKCTVVE